MSSLIRRIFSTILAITIMFQYSALTLVAAAPSGDESEPQSQSQQQSIDPAGEGQPADQNPDAPQYEPGQDETGPESGAPSSEEPPEGDESGAPSSEEPPEGDESGAPSSEEPPEGDEPGAPSSEEPPEGDEPGAPSSEEPPEGDEPGAPSSEEPPEGDGPGAPSSEELPEGDEPPAQAAQEGQPGEGQQPSAEKPACTCDSQDGVHAEDCPLYEAPVCTCDSQDGVHAEDCPLYKAPEPVPLSFSFPARTFSETGNASDGKSPPRQRKLFAPSEIADFGDRFFDQLNDIEKSFYLGLENIILSAPTEDDAAIPMVSGTGLVTPAVQALFPFTFNFDNAAPDPTVPNGYDDAMDAFAPMFQRAVDAIIKDYPVLFWLELGVGGSEYGIGTPGIITYDPVQKTYTIDSFGFSPVSRYDLGDAIADKNNLDLAVAAFDISGADDYQKLKNIHDQLATQLEYNKNAAENPYNDTYLHAHEATGALINTSMNYSVVCEGYAKAYKLLCERAGITNILVIGDGYTAPGDGGAHMWNYVRLGSKWYAVDLTWDDQPTAPGGVIHDFFLVGGDTKPVTPGIWDTTFNNSHIKSGFFSLGSYTDEFDYPILNPTAYNAAKTLVSIAVTVPPTKNEYFMGEALDESGATVIATYDDGSTADVTGTAIFTALDSTTYGPKTITATYTEDSITRTADFDVTVVRKLTSILGSPIKLVYFKGESLDTSSIVVTATYDDATTDDVTDAATFSVFDSSTYGLKPITVTYTERGVTQTDTFDVMVGRKLTSLAVVTTPLTKTSYYVGETFDDTALVIMATYDDDSTVDVTAFAQLSGFDSTQGGTVTVTASFTENGVTKTASYDVTIVKMLVLVTVTTPPDKISYFVGDSFDATGLVVTATYDDTTTEDITNLVSFSGFNSLIPGVFTVTASYDDGIIMMGDSFDVTVYRELTSLVLTAPPTQTTYYVGDVFVPAGLIITAGFADGTELDVTLDPSLTLIGFDSTQGGTVTVTASFTEGSITKTVSFDVTVIKKLTSLTITTQPDKRIYFKGDSFDKTGLVITAGYDDGSTTIVTGSAAFSGFDSAAYGNKTIAASYTENAVTEFAYFDIDVVEKLTSIAVTAPPTKTSYFVGEGLNHAGLIITATYDDLTTADVTGSVTFSALDSTSHGLKTITATYTENGVTKTVSFDVTVIKKMTSLTITTQPDKRIYFKGDSFDKTGLVITAGYDDGSTTIVTGSATFSGFDSAAYGNQTIAASYTENAVTEFAYFDIDVVKKLTSIAVAPPTKTSYFVGEGLNHAGLIITATYDDLTTADVTGSVIFSPLDSTTYGTKTITATYTENEVTKTATFDVEVVKKLTSIVVTAPPTKTSYFVGDGFDDAGLIITATYDNASTADVTATASLSGFSSALGGTVTVTASYTENGVTETAAFDVTIVRRPTKIEVTNPITKDEYFKGDTLDTTGIEITATYDDATTADVTGSATFSALDSTTHGSKTITATYIESAVTKTTTFDVTVIRKLTSLTITTQPDKLVYFKGDALDKTGAVVTAGYDDGSTTIVTGVSGFVGFDSNSYGAQTITVSYIENGVTKTDTFNVTVLKKLTSLAVTDSPTKTSYFLGEAFDTAGLVVTATYDDASTADVTATASLSGFSSADYGDKTVTASYTENGVTKTVSFTVSVVKKLVSIDIAGPITKNKYFIGEALDTAGLVITATYDDASTVDKTAMSTLSGFSSDSLGIKTITASYIENGVTKTTSFTVTVVKKLASLTVTAPPTKTSYFVGDSIDGAGLVITAAYDNASTDNVTALASLSGFSSAIGGTVTVTATYTENGVTETAAFDVTIVRRPTKIEVTTPATKDKYFLGDALDTAGINITATYDDATTADVTGVVSFSPLDSTSHGLKTITATYTEGAVTKTVTFNVTVVKKLTSIAVTAPITKDTYLTGEALNTSGIEITATYDDSSVADVTAFTTYTGFNSAAAGPCTVTANFTENGVTMADTFTVTVNNRPSSSSPRFGRSSGTKSVVITYKDGVAYKTTVDSTLALPRFVSSIAGAKPSTQVIFPGGQLPPAGTLPQSNLTAIEITSPVSKVLYYKGESFDAAGLKVTARYDNLASADVTDRLVVTGFDSSTPGIKVVTLSYTQDMITRTANLVVRVIAPATIFKNVDYAPVFDFEFYLKNYPAIGNVFSMANHPTILKHFYDWGMPSGLQGSADFRVDYYRRNYPELARMYGDDTRAYYQHYIFFGSKAGMTGKQLI
jgi:hypothetical protein